MLTLGSLGFASPWMLIALAGLPAIWWLLRVTPPAPRRVLFPAVRLLMGLRHTEETPARTPWWLLALRLFLAALIITALAKPLINPGARLIGDGPLLIVVDDGWTAATRWDSRGEALNGIIDQAARETRAVALLTTAPPQDGRTPRVTNLMPAAEARELIAAMRPKPWPVDRAAAIGALERAQLTLPMEVIWLADGVRPEDEEESARDFAARLGRLGPMTVLLDESDRLPKFVPPPDSLGARLQITVRSATPARENDSPVIVRASGENGQVLGRQPAFFGAGEQEGSAEFNLPTEARNQVVRLEIEGEASAGSVVLLDERWRRRPVGLISGGALESEQPLLSDIFYLDRALDPFSEIRRGGTRELIESRLAVLILADLGQIVAADREILESWLEEGGVLVRFAGPRLAENSDDLIPVRLRSGSRALGGALTWTTPAQLGAFTEASPFFGLTVPDDVRVSRQVLAEPSLDLSAKTWAQLQDGTPLVTAERRGDGWLVLFHTTANTAWSNLPISGLFVEMLQRIVSLSQGVSGAQAEAPLPALSTLDGFGRLGTPPATALPARPDVFAASAVGPAHPPGYYGSASARRALNLSASLVALAPLDALPEGARQAGYATDGEVDLLPWLLLAAILIVLADFLIGLGLRGQLHWRTVRGAATGLVFGAGLAAFASGTGPAAAQGDSFALDATLETRLAYVITGDRAVDEMSRAGLTGLSQMLTLRTAIEPAAPLGVDVEADELAFFALLYWPIDPAQPDLSDQALERIDDFMKNGGTIVFDTRDQQAAELSPGRFRGNSSGGPGTQRLRELLLGLDIPPLVPVPEDHVLTKAFYLLGEFPGRWDGGAVWVERHAGGTNDGVSSIIIGSNDWAAAWAIDDVGRPVAAVVPGGALQREMAYRFGINLVMYAFTGNYKADQVHIPAILERLGQ